MIVVSTGCPAGVGPEVSVAAAARASGRIVLVGDPDTLRKAAKLVGVPGTRLVPFAAGRKPGARSTEVLAVRPELRLADTRAGRPSKAAGAAQLAYIEAAYALARATPGNALVTGPVSKAAIARSGSRGAARFRGHTEWLQELDHAPHAIMCFASRRLVTSLVTTHLPVSRVPRALDARGVRDATVELVRLLHSLGKPRPTVAVASLNPHAGESELFGREEATAILPGILLARSVLGRSANVLGPVGAETAYRHAHAGRYDGVVAMYHDQATIPTKLLAFGQAVNVTMGLGLVRTSVDHGTGYDIAWTGRADPDGMLAAIHLAARLIRARRARRGGDQPEA